MIQKLIRYSLVFTLLASIVACSGTRDVTSDSPIQKRKYRKGLYVNFNKAKKQKHQVLALDNRKIKSYGSSLKEEATEPETMALSDSKRPSKKEFRRRDIIYKLARLYGLEKKNTEEQWQGISDTLDYYNPGVIQRMHPSATTSFIAGLSGITLYIILSNIAGLFDGPEALFISGLAIAFYIAAGFISLLSAIKAKKEIKRDPDKWKGRGFANAGLIFGISILGSILIALTALVIFILLLILLFGA